MANPVLNYYHPPVISDRLPTAARVRVFSATPPVTPHCLRLLRRYEPQRGMAVPTRAGGVREARANGIWRCADLERKQIGLRPISATGCLIPP